MPEVLTLAVAALLGATVGVVGFAAFGASQHQFDIEASVATDPNAFSADALAILTALPGIAIIINEDDTIARAGVAAYAKGLTRGSELAHPRLLELVRHARRSDETSIEELILPRSSLSETGTLEFRVRVCPLPRDRVFIFAEDLTQERRVAAMRRDFTANVSHELKTPVGAVRLLAETIASDPTDSDAVAHFAPKLLKESERLSALVQDIIDLSRLQAPDALNAPILIDVDDLVASAVERQSILAEAAGIDLCGPTRPTGAQVWGDVDMLTTAVRNLVDNAVRYSPSGTKVVISVEVAEALVSITVVDSGVGIAPEHTERIFERFYRVDPARSRDTGGTGLGLSIVKHVAADHGGTVNVWSSPGRGSTFTLVLPEASEVPGRTPA